MLCGIYGEHVAVGQVFSKYFFASTNYYYTDCSTLIIRGWYRGNNDRRTKWTVSTAKKQRERKREVDSYGSK
jgi:hypothetical protein